MKLKTALKLGRVSNLPTIWTNCWVGFAIAHTFPDLFSLVIVCSAFSFFYIAGMYLNDLFDYNWDKVHQPDRPLVVGEAGRKEVAVYTAILILTGIIFVVIASTGEQIAQAGASTLLLVACIVIYDWKHKQWSGSAWIMGCCRLLVYWSTALTIAPFSYTFAGPGLCLMGYIAGITYLARAEHLNKLATWWPIGLLGSPFIYALYLGKGSLIISVLALALLVWLGISVKKLLPGPRRSIPQSIADLLAGICLLDALFLAGLMYYKMAILAVLAFFLTVLLQKKIKAS